MKNSYLWCFLLAAFLLLNCTADEVAYINYNQILKTDDVEFEIKDVKIIEYRGTKFLKITPFLLHSNVQTPEIQLTCLKVESGLKIQIPRSAQKEVEFRRFELFSVPKRRDYITWQILSSDTSVDYLNSQLLNIRFEYTENCLSMWKKSTK